MVGGRARLPAGPPEHTARTPSTPAGRCLTAAADRAVAQVEYITGVGTTTTIPFPSNWYTTYADHSATYVPQQVDKGFVGQGDLAPTNFPLFKQGLGHWGVKGVGTRWEVDDM